MEQKYSELIASKNRLCKLLATEDLNIVHMKGIRTASIDLKSRTVKLPMWKAKDGTDIPGFVHDILISHEGYGHGVNTPIEGWHSELGNHSRAFKSFLNIIEDARIEKLVKRKYPGIRKSYIAGYKWIVDNEVFGKNILVRVNDGSLKFIDRLNVHAKVGSYANAKFTAEEQVYVDRMEKLETWKEVVALAEDLFKKARADKEKEKSETDDEQDMGGVRPFSCDQDDSDDSEAGDDSDSDDSDDETDGFSDSDGDDSDDETDETDGSSDSDGDDSDDDTDGDAKDSDDSDGDDSDDDTDADDSDGDKDVDSDDEKKKSDGHEGGQQEADEFDDDSDNSAPDDDSDLEAETDKSLEDGLEDLVEDEIDAEEHSIYTLPKISNPEKIVIDFKTVISENTDYYLNKGLVFEDQVKAVANWKRDNVKVVNFLVKEFEMKKAAEEYVRTSTAKTGVIDPGKLHSYKFNDDIFKKVTTVTGGKSHGLVMYVDWSGSMSNNLRGTMDQLFNLVSFCRKVNMPHEVFAFTDAYHTDSCRTECSDVITEKKENDLTVNARLRLLELFSDKMNASDFNKMMVILTKIVDGQGSGYYTENRPSESYRLGGTPLNDAILVAMGQVKQFRDKNRLQIVNTVFLTDGASAGCSAWRHFNHQPEMTIQRILLGRTSSSVTVIKNTETKKEYEVLDDFGGPTKALLEALKDIGGVEVAGFFLTSATKRSVHQWNRYFKYDDALSFQGLNDAKKALHKELKKEKFLISTDAGYSELYIIAGGSSLETGNTSMEDVEVGASKAKLKSAFLKAGNSKLKQRVVLSKFIDMVA